MISRLILLILIILSFLSKNKSMTIAATIILILSFKNTENIITIIQEHFMNIGTTFLMIWMLVPLIKTHNSISLNIKNLINIKVFISFLSGIFVVILASKGLNFLSENGDILTYIVIGSIIGVTFLGGIPVGPLTASGIAYEIVKIINLIFKSILKK